MASERRDPDDAVRIAPGSNPPRPGAAGSACSDGPCGCAGDLARRDFLWLTAWSMVGLATSGWNSVAGPFTEADFERLVPADKKLSPEWVRSLFERGSPGIYRGEELRHIGMPVGGLCAGQLYLGGDGRLWLWDIFNQPPAPEFSHYAGPHYARPIEPFSPLDHGFALKVTQGEVSQVRLLDRRGFDSIEFRGQYPVGFVAYEDPALPVRVRLEAFSPFIPLNLEDSSLPATLLEYTVVNTGTATVEVELAGWLENAVCLGTGRAGRGVRRNRVDRERGMLLVASTAEAAPPPAARAARPDIPFEDFEHDTYGAWTASGTAFGSGPIAREQMPGYQGDVGGQGRRWVNTHNARDGEDVSQADAHVGTLVSPEFVIERDHINFLVGGGAHRDKTCVQLVIGGQPVLSVTGQNDNRMQAQSWDVRAWAGQRARLRIVDNERGGWGNIGVDDIVFSDTPGIPPIALQDEEDFGSMALAVLDPGRDAWGAARVDCPVSPESLFHPGGRTQTLAQAPFGTRLCGAVGRRWKLKPGAAATATFVVAWHFPAVRRGSLSHVTDISRLRRAYAARFDGATAVARYISQNAVRLKGDTRLWHRTWYEDSTLPWWFLDRTFLNNSIGATATCYQFDNGRFYGWEGTYCCAGTCQHVWQYAQGLARVFPQLERAARELTDYGIAFHEDTGALDYRAEAHRVVAIDGQAGTILRVYREHQMSADDAFLRRIWPRVRHSIEYLIRQDANDDGVLEGEQYNTLDAAWYGRIPWLSSLYLAALRAGAAMAREMGDDAFAARCDQIVDRGSRRITDELFNGRYFIQRLDPDHPEAINTNDGCHIDQVYGQSWAFQVGLPRVLPPEPTRQALQSLWRYNFSPDVGVYRKRFEVLKGGRWYAMPGEGGLLMCTWPTGGAEKAAGKGDPTFVGYFNECMTGFEYQVAGHMVWEGLVEQGLAITRMIHDRYHASRRNPWNEVECSSHYARAMASYGVFLAACGFEYHGPRGHLGFAPRWSAGHFRAAFTAADGWGTLEQTVSTTPGGPPTQIASVAVRWGRLPLRTLSVERVPELGLDSPPTVEARAGRRSLTAQVRTEGRRVEVTLNPACELRAGEVLELRLTAPGTSRP